MDAHDLIMLVLLHLHGSRGRYLCGPTYACTSGSCRGAGKCVDLLMLVLLAPAGGQVSVWTYLCLYLWHLLGAGKCVNLLMLVLLGFAG